jgi:hypothetical protein
MIWRIEYRNGTEHETKGRNAMELFKSDYREMVVKAGEISMNRIIYNTRAAMPHMGFAMAYYHAIEHLNALVSDGVIATNGDDVYWAN